MITKQICNPELSFTLWHCKLAERLGDRWIFWRVGSPLSKIMLMLKKEYLVIISIFASFCNKVGLCTKKAIYQKILKRLCLALIGTFLGLIASGNFRSNLSVKPNFFKKQCSSSSFLLT
jgi:hypothetical protein